MGQTNLDTPKDFNQLSEHFLQRIKLRLDTQEIQKQLSNANLEDLKKALKTDEQKLAFWINVYNAYILEILTENPNLYDDKKTFFKKEQIPIAGEQISFEKIEHGILRKSQWPSGLGYVRKWFPNAFERKLRVRQRDYRIHFALNCGAKDCPPIAIYSPKNLDKQLENATSEYLKRTSKFDPNTKEIAVTALFQWFRGDFGGKRGLLKILDEYGIIPTTRGVNPSYNPYDWSLDLDNWANP